MRRGLFSIMLFVDTLAGVATVVERANVLWLYAGRAATWRGCYMKTCCVVGCTEELSNPKHQFCRRHWRLEKDGGLAQGVDGNWAEVGTSTSAVEQDDADQNDSPITSSSGMLSSTKLGKHFGLSATRMNLILAELGWIEKYVKGWTATNQDSKLGAQVREARQTGVPYVVWPPSILINKVLEAAVAESLGGSSDDQGEEDPPGVTDSPITSKFRERFPAKFRATDGHWVRSRAEMLIDNWLYMQGVVHAFERKLPIEEEVYCDFYLPRGKVYIEYWGMENDPKYATRMQTKQQIYQRYNLNLLELTDEHIMNLDDMLPRMLLKFGIDCT